MALGRLSRGLAALLVVATFRGAGSARLSEDHRAELRWPLIIAVTTAVWAIVMWVADRRAAGAGNAEGAGQIRSSASPGARASRSARPGARVDPRHLALGHHHHQASWAASTARRRRASPFLLGIPITAAGADKALHLARTGLPPGELGPLLGRVLVAAFVSGWFAVWFLVSYLKTRSLRPFVVYRLLLALGIVLVVLRG